MESQIDLLRVVSILSAFFGTELCLGKKKPEKAPVEDDGLTFSFAVDFLTFRGILFYRLSTSIRELQNFKVLLQQTR